MRTVGLIEKKQKKTSKSSKTVKTLGGEKNAKG